MASMMLKELYHRTPTRAGQALAELEAHDLVEQLKRRPIVVRLGDKALTLLGIHRYPSG